MRILNTWWREMRSKGEKLQDGWQRRIRNAVRRGTELRRGVNEADRCKKPVQKAGHTEERLSEQSNERATMQDDAQWGEQWLDNVRALSVYIYVLTSIRTLPSQLTFPSGSHPLPAPRLALCPAATSQLLGLQGLEEKLLIIFPSCHRLVQVRIRWSHDASRWGFFHL